ncbi:hypothetical protein E0W68_10050 [Flavobacterium salilacus subsp. salilacus]|uniref:energy transducer TonB n=1 Tax=Flavobacterium TaxID=237 RepID=UPI0010751677|nr:MULTISPECIES: energy transducer TonB [Flavobacterium]KAF2518354.1 hypothetical protein E0W68_10050 [Flavobacterium salilacus subsp. salilacus]MBE1615231.1 energy transducer TonB [Flavobacterium sp. SaA2.13]
MKTLIVIALTFLSTFSIAQNVIEYKGEKINALDENHQPTGVWKLYDEEKQLMIVTEFENGIPVAPTKYYKGDTLIAVYTYEDGFEIYKDGKTYIADYYRSPDGRRALVDIDGNEIESSVMKYFSDSGQIMPMYYGGQAEMYKFIGENVNRKSIKNNKGKIKVKFVIDAIGETSEIEVIESTNPKLNEEAKRLVSILPRWQPGHQAGAFVKCPYIIPITIN